MTKTSLNRRDLLKLSAIGAVGFTGVNLFSIGRGKAAAAINIYSARHYDTDLKLYEGFTQKTGIAINRIEAVADQLIERMKSEGAASPADLLITVDAGRLVRAQDAGLFKPVKSAVLEAAIPAHLREPGGLWFSVSKRARVVMYNKDKVKPEEITTYEALVDPKWKGRLLTRSSTNIYSQSLTGSVLAALGAEKTEEWARGLVANFAREPRGGDTDQIKAVAAGEGDICLSNTYYLGNLIKSSKAEDKAVADKIGVVFPNQGDRGTHVNVSGIGLSATAKNPEGAIQFMEYLVSPEAQSYFAGQNSEYPVIAGAEVPSSILGFGTFKEDQLNAAVFAKNNAEALKIMDRAGWK